MIASTAAFFPKAGRAGCSIFQPNWTSRQWPGPGFGTFSFRQIFARATSEIPDSFASLVAGIFQILSYSSSRVIFVGSFIVGE